MTYSRRSTTISRFVAIAAIPVLALWETAAIVPAGQDSRIEKIHDRFVFADTHAHPSQFHRANVERIEPDELGRYRRELINIVVCSVSSDAAYQGGYTNSDGTTIKRLQAPNDYPLEPGVAFSARARRPRSAASLRM